MTTLIKYWIAAILLLNIHPVSSQNTEQKINAMVDSVYAAHPRCTGIITCVISNTQKINWSHAMGYADRIKGLVLAADHPVLIASNTKTYISATVLKLAEQKKLNLDAPIENNLSAVTKAKLTGCGYNLKKITAIHLLSHTSGIRDYADDNYFEYVNTHRDHRWTRDEQITLATKLGKPLALPADTFKYADINYLLLTEIIETLTKKPFYRSLRTLLNLDSLNLKNTSFETLETKPADTKTLAHQTWQKYPWDSYDLDPSWDLYGGGGIAATACDLAGFFQNLFEGKIIKDKQILSRIYADVPCKTKTNYCLGVRKLKIAGLTGYYHGGFWGTDALYFPELKVSVCIVILERSEKDISSEICRMIVELLKAQK